MRRAEVHSVESANDRAMTIYVGNGMKKMVDELLSKKDKDNAPKLYKMMTRTDAPPRWERRDGDNQFVEAKPHNNKNRKLTQLEILLFEHFLDLKKVPLGTLKQGEGAMPAGFFLSRKPYQIEGAAHHLKLVVDGNAPEGEKVFVAFYDEGGERHYQHTFKQSNFQMCSREDIYNILKVAAENNDSRLRGAASRFHKFLKDLDAFHGGIGWLVSASFHLHGSREHLTLKFMSVAGESFAQWHLVMGDGPGGSYKSGKNESYGGKYLEEIIGGANGELKATDGDLDWLLDKIEKLIKSETARALVEELRDAAHPEKPSVAWRLLETTREGLNLSPGMLKFRNEPSEFMAPLQTHWGVLGPLNKNDQGWAVSVALKGQLTEQSKESNDGTIHKYESVPSARSVKAVNDERRKFCKMHYDLSLWRAEATLALHGARGARALHLGAEAAACRDLLDTANDTLRTAGHAIAREHMQMREDLNHIPW